MVDKAPPDFELLVKKINRNTPTPKFKGDWEKRLSQYDKGLTVIRADQCPYSVKNVKEISETAEKVYGIKPNIIDLKNCKEAQNSPCLKLVWYESCVYKFTDQQLRICSESYMQSASEGNKE